MPNKLKKLYCKLKKGFKKHKSKKLIIVPQTQLFTKEQKQILKKTPKIKENKTLTVKKPNYKKDKKNLKKVKEKPPKSTNVDKPKKEEKSFKIGSSLRKSFKKVREKLKVKKHKKKKIIGSKKLAVLLTSTTIAALLPMFNLNPVPALAAVSTCVFTINFIMIKTIKKFLKQRKEANNLKATIDNVSITSLSAKEKNKE